MRKARIIGTRITDQISFDESIERYLPLNYYIGETYIDMEDHYVVEIWGEDEAGWTLDGYVIPRLASGLIFAEEIK